ncbi:MAG: hypothetical protein O2798_06510 [Chloroflexi bacterium]|nr:hypothetical protein [Chloroflexota bacterium]MDA1240483.1 hypothetical protein [Chloroflexota bacterium]
MTALLVFLAALAALVQGAAAPMLFVEPVAAPVLPAALIAAWAVMRGPDEAWPALLLPAVILGALSDERAGWFLIAMLPAPALGALIAARARRTGAGITRRSLWAAMAAAVAALAYGLVLALAAGVLAEVPHLAAPVVGGMLLTALVTLLAAPLVWPLRQRERGLFS